MKLNPEIDLSSFPKSTQDFIRPLLASAWEEGWLAPDGSRAENNPYGPTPERGPIGEESSGFGVAPEISVIR